MAIFSDVLNAVDPERLVRENLALDGDELVVGTQRHELRPDGKIVLLGVGKSAIGMARGVEAVLGDRLDHGFVVTKRGLSDSHAMLRRTRVVEAAHPVPDESSLAAGVELLRQADALGERDLAIVVVSGGGSALVEEPVAGVSLDDLRATTSTLLRGGADISTLNAVRRRLSRIKAGGLARAIAPARLINLVLSDVLGNPLSVIASGLSVKPDVDEDPLIHALRASAVWKQLPGSVRKRLVVSSEPEASSHPNAVQSLIVGDSATTARAAAAASERLGYEPHLLGTTFAGDAQSFGRFWAQLACAVSDGNSAIHPPACIIGAGEQTVVVRGNGSGGRNTEMTVAAAFELAGHERVAVGSLATDGDDGNSGAAGGVVVGDTIRRLILDGLDPKDFVARSDTRALLDSSRGLIVTGQTGINLNDLYLALVI